RLSTWPVFGNGWGRRVREVKAAALAMADKAQAAKAVVPGERRETRDPVTTAPSVNTGSPQRGVAGRPARGRRAVIVSPRALAAAIAGAAHFLGAHPVVVAAAAVTGVALAFFIPSNLQGGD